MKIYVACFNKKANVKNDIYTNLQLGAYKKRDEIFDCYDNDGDNISEKNKYYCELTGLYWIWKNIKEDIIGLVHYRRFFYKSFFSNKDDILQKQDIEKILKNNDIILPKKEILVGNTVYSQYKKTHDIKEIEEVKKIISEIYPDYLNSFNKIMKRRKFYICNMFIAKKELIDEYCEWLFNILSELDNRIDFSKRDNYNARTPGFLGERLFNVWIEKNNFRICEKNIFNIELSFFLQKIKIVIKRFIGLFYR